MPHQLDTDLVTLSDALLRARRIAKPLQGFPGDVPGSLEAAYAVQCHSIGKWHDELVGFKVGGIPFSFRDRYPCQWQTGPIFRQNIYHVANGETVDVRVFEGGFAAYEAEFVFELANLESLTETPVTLESCLDFVEAVYLGAEIASSPMPMVNALGPGSIISDFGNNAGMVLGPKLDVEDLNDLSDIDVTLDIDRQLIGRARAKSGADGPLGALHFLLSHLHEYRHRIDLPETLYLSSGAITGVHESVTGTVCDINYSGQGGFRLAMIKQPPL